ncbi:MAG: hypothetical protein NVS3B1_10090 [Marmoricola sp.]
MEDQQRGATPWDIDRGFTTIPLSAYSADPGDASWEPHRFGTTLQFLIPPAVIGFVAVAASAAMGGGWSYAILGSTGFAALLSCGFLVAAFLNLRFVGIRRCIFTADWVGVQRRHEIDLVRYSTIRTMWVSGETRYGAWQRAESGQIHFARQDGMPVRLPRLLTYTRRDRAAFFSFVYAQATRHSLPIQGR